GGRAGRTRRAGYQMPPVREHFVAIERYRDDERRRRRGPKAGEHGRAAAFDRRTNRTGTTAPRRLVENRVARRSRAGGAGGGRFTKQDEPVGMEDPDDAASADVHGAQERPLR